MTGEGNEIVGGNCRQGTWRRTPLLVLSGTALPGLTAPQQPLPLAWGSFSSLSLHLPWPVSVTPSPGHLPLAPSPCSLFLGFSLLCFLVSDSQAPFLGVLPHSRSTSGGCLIQLTEAPILHERRAVAEIMPHVHQILFYSLSGKLEGS